MLGVQALLFYLSTSHVCKDLAESQRTNHRRKDTVAQSPVQVEHLGIAAGVPCSALHGTYLRCCLRLPRPRPFPPPAYLYRNQAVRMLARTIASFIYCKASLCLPGNGNNSATFFHSMHFPKKPVPDSIAAYSSVDTRSSAGSARKVDVGLADGTSWSLNMTKCRRFDWSYVKRPCQIPRHGASPLCEMSGTTGIG